MRVTDTSHPLEANLNADGLLARPRGWEDNLTDRIGLARQDAAIRLQSPVRFQRARADADGGRLTAHEREVRPQAHGQAAVNVIDACGSRSISEPAARSADRIP